MVKQLVTMIMALVVACATPAFAKGKTDTVDPTTAAVLALDWKRGPLPQPVTSRATIKLPPKAMYLDAANTAKFLRLTGNLPEPESYTIAADDLSWFAIVDFADMGYVKDDEKIDPDALLSTMREQQAEANTQRAAQKLDALTIKGWVVVPHYDRASRNLEYGIGLASPGGENVNYKMRMLGRRGVMNADLVTSGDTLQRDLAAFRTVMQGFAFNADETYAAYKDGDRVAEYGLAALVTGGAAAAVLKTGLLGGLLKGLLVFWKLIAVGVVGLFAFIGRFFKRATGGGEDLGPPPGDQG
jgi:uncharacterized membrane-anchored protein